MVLPWNVCLSVTRAQLAASKYTHVRPRDGQAISKLLCFLDEEVVLLPAKFVCADESSNVTDSALKEAADVIHTRYRLIEFELQGTYLTGSAVFDSVKLMLCVKLSASLKKS